MIPTGLINVGAMQARDPCELQNADHVIEGQRINGGNNRARRYRRAREVDARDGVISAQATKHPRTRICLRGEP